MGVATAMFNTVYEAEAAVRALRGDGTTDILIVARERNKREVLVDDLITRARIFYDTDVELIDITDRFPLNFLQAVQQDFPPNAQRWFQQWLDNGFILVAAYTNDGIEDAKKILLDHGGSPYGTTFESLSVFPDTGEKVERVESAEMPIERRWRRSA